MLGALLELDVAAHDVGDVAERDDTANQRAAGIVEALAVDAEYGIALVAHLVRRNLVGKLLAATGLYERQVVVPDRALTVGGHVAKVPCPFGVGLLTRLQSEHRPRRGIDVQDMAVSIHDDGAVIDVLEYRQHGAVGFGKSREQPIALDGVIDDRLDLLVAGVVDAEITLRACPDGGDAAVFLLAQCHCDDRQFVQELQYRWHAPAGTLGDADGFEDDQVGAGRDVAGPGEIREPGDVAATAPGFEFIAETGREIAVAEIKNRPPRHLSYIASAGILFPHSRFWRTAR